MRFTRTIGIRIVLGFGLLILAIILNAVFSYRIVESIQQTQKEFTGILDPSIRQLIRLQSTLHESEDLLRAWEYSGWDPASPLLEEHRLLLQSSLPAIHRRILDLSDGWRDRDRDTYLDLYAYINDSLFSNLSRYTSGLTRPGRSDTVSVRHIGELRSYYRFSVQETGNLIQTFDRLAAQVNERTEAIYRRTLRIMLVTGIIIALAAILIAALLYFAIVNPVRQYSNAITDIGKGVIPDRTFREGSDEMGRIGAALNNMIRSLRALAVFAEEIGKGNFKSEFSPLSERDILGNSLIRLRENLQTAAVEEIKRKREDERRHWSNHGIARFSELLREHSGNTKTLSDKLISELVNYLGAKVGGIFLIRTGGKEPGVIEMIASYAYGRTKHLKKTIQPGEGLIGRCVQEGRSIFITDIPRDYVKIKSGLGQDDPKSLLIVPVRLNERIIGVIEIASFEILQDYQIEFVERIGTSIASSLGHAG